MGKSKFEIKKSKKNGQYFVRLKGGNGEILNVSETFKLKGNAIKNINAVIRAILEMTTARVEGSDVEDVIITTKAHIEDLTNENDGLEEKDSPRDDK